MSRVDVIVPCYRYGYYLPDCVRSVLSQPVDLRLLIIDDASPDDSADVAAMLAAQDSRVTLRVHEQNAGHIATYNEGLDWADGDYVLLISADDVLTPNALARAVNVLDANPKVALEYGRVIHFEGEVPHAAPRSSDAYRIRSGQEWIARYLRDPWIGITSPEALMRNSALRRAGCFRPDLPHSADAELWMRIALEGDVAYLDADQAFYREHARAMHTQRFGAPARAHAQLAAAFDGFLDRHGHRLNDPRRMRRLANAGLARMALLSAHYCFSAGDLIAFDHLRERAMELYPASRAWPLYARTELMRVLGPGAWKALRRAAGRG